ncbi:hypothetical protein PoB_007048000 [Plakobranchus ocellatus]|uniref:G-protein coupled receptors family 1 profile domain-containing protein n=1 Tax=Plakobranchus ocellatus TaxID=259542 RepID=A0AAV4DIL4_9GAST|nr:hypothetical protein PoB_007048000 [Plakobranchus ocellatus]
MDKPASNGTQYAFPYRGQFLYTFWILSASWPGILLFGLFADMTNIVIFLKAGVKDNVTTLLLSLSVSDLIFLFLLNPIVSSSIILSHAPDWQWPFSSTFTFSEPCTRLAVAFLKHIYILFVLLASLHILRFLFLYLCVAVSDSLHLCSHAPAVQIRIYQKQDCNRCASSVCLGSFSACFYDEYVYNSVEQRTTEQRVFSPCDKAV